MVLGFSGLLPNAAVGLASVVLLVFGAEKVVGKMEGVAKAYGISEVVIAMTIISVGTSLPEISLHLVGSFNILTNPGNQQLYQQISATVLGSNIGSDVVQQTLVLGLVVLVTAFMRNSRGFKFSRKFLLRDYAPMMGTTLLTLILAWDRTLSVFDGLVLLNFFIAYMYYLYSTRDEKLQKQGSSEPSQRPRYDLVTGIVFMLLVIYSADVFLKVVELGIEATGLSGSMIGVATVGVVSAMPEMVTAITGLRQGAEGISLGTLIGSNITNPLLAIGAGATLSTYAVPEPLVLWDLPMETATAGVLLIYLLNKGRIGDFLGSIAGGLGFEKLAQKFRSTEDRFLTMTGAVLLMLMYVFYLYVRWTYFPTDFH
ncbi:MAG: sodium:calcium antiporter [Candidatus Nanohaloarchaea archaeon]